MVLEIPPLTADSPFTTLYTPWGGRKRRFRVRDQSSTLPTKYILPYTQDRLFTGQYSHTADTSPSDISPLSAGFGLMDYVARWYDPYLNRFIQPDSIVPDAGNPIAYDRYAYSANNPLRYSDPSGHSWWDAVGQFATGFVTEFARTNAWYAPHAQDALAVSATESDAMLAGRVVADIATIAIGVTEVIGGVTIGTAGTAVSCGATLCLGAVATVGAGAAVTAYGATTAMSGAAGLGGNLAQLTGNSSSSSSDSGGSIIFDQKTFQHEYSNHAADFGITGNWNTQNGQAFQQAILDHINGQDTQVIQGTYRGNISGTHYYNPQTNLWVFVDSNGNYRASWKLSLEQQQYLLSKGNIQ